MKRIFRLGATTLLLAAGCATSTGDLGAETVGTTQEDITVKVTGAAASLRLESVVNTSTDSSLPGGQVVTVAFNDFTGIKHDAAKNVASGSTYLGFATSTNGGNTFTYGGLIAPTDPNFPVLRGDPSIASYWMDQRQVYVGNLAEPKSDFAADGSQISDVPTGGCLYKSSNGGQSFSLLKCVSTNGAQVDGDSLAVGDDGSVYFATVEISNHVIDVWRIDPVTGNATKLPSPFADAGDMHPRLRAEHGAGRVYVMTLDASGSGIVANYWNGSNWAGEHEVASGYSSWDIDFNVGGGVRRGPNFSFDLNPAFKWTQCKQTQVCVVGGKVVPPTINGCPGVWEYQYQCHTYSNDNYSFVVAYTAQSGARTVVKTVACTHEMIGCAEVPVWEPQTTVGDQWEPVVRGRNISYLSRQNAPSGNTFDVYGGSIALTGSSTPILNMIGAVVQAGGVNVCPHGGGYLGDYDDMDFVPTQPGVSSYLVRTYTQSPSTCDNTNWTDQSVSAALWQ